ncbi:hypothetical protein [Asticcacaulis sp. W401b]
MLDELRPEDGVVVSALDRLASSLSNLFWNSRHDRQKRCLLPVSNRKH